MWSQIRRRTKNIDFGIKILIIFIIVSETLIPPQKKIFSILSPLYSSLRQKWLTEILTLVLNVIPFTGSNKNPTNNEIYRESAACKYLCIRCYSYDAFKAQINTSRNITQNLLVLAYLSGKLNWASLIACCPSSACLYVRLFVRPSIRPSVNFAAGYGILF